MEVNRVYNGTCLEVLKGFPDNSIDSCVTDPPYGISFMNKHWDYDVPKVEVWQEIYRVLKPGAHVLCACGTRTQHRMAVNIEDAGFEIRDIISWIYGSGFPKSLNVNKQLENEICKCKMASKSDSEYSMQPLSDTDIQAATSNSKSESNLLQSGLQEQGTHRTVQRDKPEQGVEDGKEPCMEGRSNNVQEEGQLQEHKIHSGRGLDKADGKKGRVHNGTQGSDGKTLQEVIDKDGSSTSCRPRPNEQQSEELGTISEQCNTQGNGAWETCSGCGKPVFPDGIGTALKPATELWTLARKPLSEKTVAANVLKYGTGGINIDGSRIETSEDLSKNYDSIRKGDNQMGERGYKLGFRQNKDSDAKAPENLSLGRFPANVIFDEFTGKILDEQSGINTNTRNMSYKRSGGEFIDGISNKEEDAWWEQETGGASRFFYTPKADNYERNKGLKDFDLKKPEHDFGTKLGEPRNERVHTLKRNPHPTVKPIDLMRYLVKLITPKKGICLDPYCGSGTTLIGCKMELINYIGIEREEEYCKISEARVAAWNPDLYKPQELF